MMAHHCYSQSYHTLYDTTDGQSCHSMIQSMVGGDGRKRMQNLNPIQDHIVLCTGVQYSTANKHLMDGKRRLCCDNISGQPQYCTTLYSTEQDS